ncbi:MAG TPA: fructosamine kinase family protein [Anaerolineales bacterium]|nr:fructosamine kinase family protein [Anaerolineales bacterium]HRQ92818.1 fructosamine kinase family protein [Anaerolineales bacterium]
MKLPPAATAWLERHDGVVASSPAAGGCINNGAHLRSQSGAAFFIKSNAHAPAGMFTREAEGLAALAATNTLRVPTVHLAGDNFLLLEDLQPAPRAADYWQQFGRGLAELHSHTHTTFGFAHDNYIGSTPQPNGWLADGHEFFAERRLSYQARLAHSRSLLSAGEVAAIERIAARLPQLVPPQPASLQHGDLWAGNAISDAAGAPALIDPAAHFGWAEAELAMTALFGGFPPEFYAAYSEAHPLEPGWHERFDVYNLYHLLNHLNIFGSSYYAQVMEVVGRFGG